MTNVLNKIVLGLATLGFGLSTFANETIEVRIGVAVARTEIRDGAHFIELRQNIAPVKVELVDRDEAFRSGEGTVSITVDKIVFDAIVSVSRFGTGSYNFDVKLNTTDPSTNTAQVAFLGYTKAWKVQDLNTVRWFGQKVVNGNLTLAPEVLIEMENRQK